MFAAVTAYKVAETLYFSFALAFVFKAVGFQGALVFFAFQCCVLAGGYWGALWLMARSAWWSARTLQGSGVLIGVGLSVAGVLPTPEWSMAALLVAASASGAAIAAKQWHELTRTAGAVRESYLALAQATGAMIRVGGLGLCALLLGALHNDVHRFFVITGLVVAALIVWAGPLKAAVPVPEAPHPGKPLRTRAFWSNAPFFLLEAGGSAVRDLVGVTGALTIVGSVSGYGWLSTTSAVVSTMAMVWLAGRPIHEPSFARLRLGLVGVAIGWLSFAGALVWPLLLALSMVVMAFAAPLVGASYDSLVMKSMESAGASLQSNAVARELLLLLARGVAMALTAGLTVWATTPRGMLFIALGLTLATLPLEYALAHRLARGSKAATT